MYGQQDEIKLASQLAKNFSKFLEKMKISYDPNDVCLGSSEIILSSPELHRLYQIGLGGEILKSRIAFRTINKLMGQIETRLIDSFSGSISRDDFFQRLSNVESDDNMDGSISASIFKQTDKIIFLQICIHGIDRCLPIIKGFADNDFYMDLHKCKELSKLALRLSSANFFNPGLDDGWNLHLLIAAYDTWPYRRRLSEVKTDILNEIFSLFEEYLEAEKIRTVAY